MLIHKHWFVGTGILIAGSLAAMPFQRHTTDGDLNPQELSVPNNPSATNTKPATELALPLPEGSLQSPAAALYETATEKQEKRHRLPISPPTVSLMPAPIPEIADRYPQPDKAAQSTPSQLAHLPASALSPRMLTQHRIRNGDTLASIAEHYLGNANLAGWIYNQNKHLIRRPDLLPIGIEIHIPAKPSGRPLEQFDPDAVPQMPAASLRQPARKAVPPAPMIPADERYPLQLNMSR